MILHHHPSVEEAINSLLSMDLVLIVVCTACRLGLLWAFINYLGIRSVDVKAKSGLADHQQKLILEIGEKIADGASEFLKQEYLVCLIFVLLMFVVIYGAVEQFKTAYTASAFLLGAITSMLCGLIGMQIAIYTNYRVAFCARRGLADAFKTAYRGGTVMGFALVSIALLTLTLLIVLFQRLMGLSNTSGEENHYYLKLFEAITGYGLGGSTVALFGRVGGGIYTKAADVGADLVGKIEQNLAEDSPKNPATIADNVGDNVGDIAGMGADLFGSFAESTCAALVISSNTLFAANADGVHAADIHLQNLMFPLVLVAFGIVVCILTSIIGVYVNNVDYESKIESALKYQIIISTVLLAGAIYGAAIISYPQNFVLTELQGVQVLHPWKPYLCALFGLVSGMLIGMVTEYMTSHSYQPVRDVAGSCETGPATNIIYGLALGYMSTVVPVILIALTAYGACHFMGYYGVALAALGMLSNLPISLALDGYGPISDNAGGISEMSELGAEVRRRTDSLDAAGNTTAAIGKGFAIGSATLVALSLYGGFLHNSGLTSTQTPISLTDPMLFAMLLIGAMLPYAFSALTMKSVGKAALKMVEEIRRQIREKPGILTGTVEPDYKACIRISTRSSLIEMIAPGCLVTICSYLGHLHSYPNWACFRSKSYRWIPPRSHHFWCATRHICCQLWRCLGQC